MQAIQSMKTVEQFNTIISADKPVVALFTAKWCGDCRYIEPFIADVQNKFQHELAFVELDRDQFPDLCEQLGILGIPSFIVFHHGQEIVRFVSKLRKTREEIERFLDRAISVIKALPQ